MEIALKPVDRSNWRTMVRFQLKQDQHGFVSPPACSLARCYVRFSATSSSICRMSFTPAGRLLATQPQHATPRAMTIIGLTTS